MKINHVTLLVKDKKRSLDFYNKVLGLDYRVVFKKHLWIKVGLNQYIHLSDNSGKPLPDTQYHVSIEINNLKKIVKKLQDNKVRHNFIDEQILQVRDPDGNLIEFIDSKNKFFK